MKLGIAMAACFLTAAVMTVVAVYVGINGTYEYEAAIQSHWNLADKSSTIPKKAEHLDRYVDALSRQGFEGKYNAAIYPTADNSFDHNFEALKTLQGRLHEIAQMDVTSFQYQTAIQQITQQEQGEAQAMLSVFEGVWWKTHHPILWDWWFGLYISGIVLLAVVGIILGFIKMDY